MFRKIEAAAMSFAFLGIGFGAGVSAQTLCTKAKPAIAQYHAPCAEAIDYDDPKGRVEGKTSQWKEEWSVSTDFSTIEYLKQLNSSLTTEERWARVDDCKRIGETAASYWKFADDQGNDWRATVSVKPGKGENELVVTMIITSDPL